MALLSEDEAKKPEEDVSKKRNILKSSIIGYFENTTVHGFAYLPSSSITNRLEKVFWALVNNNILEQDFQLGYTLV